MQITRKGQVTIPQDVRERHGFLPHTGVEFHEEDGRVYIIKSENLEVRESPFDYVRGKADAGLSTEEIMSLTRGYEKSVE